MSKKNSFVFNEKVGCGTLLFTLIVSIFLWLIGPALSYFGGWLVGNVTGAWFGDTLINGVNTLFNTDVFTVDKMPTYFGALAMIGSFFKGSSASTTVNKWIND